MDRNHDMQEYQRIRRWNGGTPPPALGRIRRRPVPPEDEEETAYYTVVYENSPQQIITRVNQLCREGWTPLGGIAVVMGEHVYYVQALWNPEAWEENAKEGAVADDQEKQGRDGS